MKIIAAAALIYLLRGIKHLKMRKPFALHIQGAAIGA
jgi:hypothetical protein